MLSQKKADKLRDEISRLRKKGGIKARELEAIASGIGRKRKDEKGKEPRWEHPEYGRDLRPLTIPNHSGDLKRFTARNILDQLESDLDWLEEAGKIR